MATDYSREAMLKASLQSIADDAALAGASVLNLSASNASAITVATNYFNKGLATLANSAAVSAPVVTAPNSVSVTVSASATLKTTLMGIFQASMPVNVTATAQGPGYTIKVTYNSGFTISAADCNSIYYYIVPSTGGIPLDLSAYTELFTNCTSIDPNFQVNNQIPKKIVAGPTQQIGFAFLNQTGAANPGYYRGGTNQYGAAVGSYHYFFSSLPVPTNYPGLGYTNQGTFYTGVMNALGTGCSSRTAITGTVNNYLTNVGGDSLNACASHPCTTLVNGVVYNNNLTINGACSTPTTGAATCQQLYNTPETYGWNDLGGINPITGAGTDDYDYGNSNYTVNCVPNTLPTNSSGPAQVILTQ